MTYIAYIAYKSSPHAKCKQQNVGNVGHLVLIAYIAYKWKGHQQNAAIVLRLPTLPTIPTAWQLIAYCCTIVQPAVCCLLRARGGVGPSVRALRWRWYQKKFFILYI